MNRLIARATASALALTLTAEPVVFATVPLSATALLMAACTGQTSSQLTQDVQLLSSGLAGIVTALQNPALKVPAATLAQVQTAIANLQADAAQVGNALTPNTNTVQAIGNIVNTVATLVTPYFPLAPIVQTVVDAALALLPTILSFVSAAAPAKASTAAATMAPDQARLVLKAAPAMLGR